MLLLLVAALACATTSVRADGWQQGRATHYGDEPWYWSIHHGSCGKGYLWPDQVRARVLVCCGGHARMVALTHDPPTDATHAHCGQPRRAVASTCSRS
jgi:hypothetical protein